MGIYIYSMRAKTVNLHLGPGYKVAANLYSYAYRHSSMWPSDPGYSIYNLTADNTVRHAEAAFNNPNRSGYVILGDRKDADGLIDAPVYHMVTNPVWYDTDRFPGELAGWVSKVGNKYYLAGETRWTTGKTLRDGVWCDYRRRLYMKDGVAKEDEEITLPSCKEIFMASEHWVRLG